MMRHHLGTKAPMENRILQQNTFHMHFFLINLPSDPKNTQEEARITNIFSRRKRLLVISGDVPSKTFGQKIGTSTERLQRIIWIRHIPRGDGDFGRFQAPLCKLSAGDICYIN